MKLRVAAKINADLYVFPAQNGYHPIDSIFMSVGLYDEIDVETAHTPQRDVEFHGPHAQNIPAHNTVTKAITALTEYHEKSVPHLKIVIKKNIPQGAGLGGGSADAAGVLQALNQLLELGLSTETLATLGSQVGSDVPFFLTGGTARITGRGEHIQPLAVSAGWVALIKPSSLACSTGRIYQRWDELYAHAPPRLLPDVRPSFINALYHAVFSLHPEFEPWLLRLKQAGFGKSALTGSGSAFFTLCATQSQAEQACALFSGEAFDTWALPLVSGSFA